MSNVAATMLHAGSLLPHQSLTVRAVMVVVLQVSDHAGDPGQRPTPAVMSTIKRSTGWSVSQAAEIYQRNRKVSYADCRFDFLITVGHWVIYVIWGHF